MTKELSAGDVLLSKHGDMLCIQVLYLSHDNLAASVVVLYDDHPTRPMEIGTKYLMLTPRVLESFNKLT